MCVGGGGVCASSSSWYGSITTKGPYTQRRMDHYPGVDDVLGIQDASVQGESSLVLYNTHTVKPLSTAHICITLKKYQGIQGIRIRERDS